LRTQLEKVLIIEDPVERIVQVWKIYD